MRLNRHGLWALLVSIVASGTWIWELVRLNDLNSLWVSGFTSRGLTVDPIYSPYTYVMRDSWSFFVLAAVYLVVVSVVSQIVGRYHLDTRLLYSCHLAFGLLAATFLALSLAFTFDYTRGIAFLGIVAAVLGAFLPYLLLKRP
jgi:hypothetical protein